MDEIFEMTDRGEREYYRKSGLDLVNLPLTKDGYEALLECASAIFNLPIDDTQRSVMAGYIHHLGKDENQISINALARVLYKQIANLTSWRIDQEAKQRRQDAEKLAAEEKAKTEASDVQEPLHDSGIH